MECTRTFATSLKIRRRVGVLRGLGWLSLSQAVLQGHRWFTSPRLWSCSSNNPIKSCCGRWCIFLWEMWDSVWSLSPIVQFSCCWVVWLWHMSLSQVTSGHWLLITTAVLNLSVIIWCLCCAIYCCSKCTFINIWILFQAYFQKIVEIFSVLQDFLYCLINLNI